MAVRKRTNPNGANQYQLDPRQKLCWEFYVDPKSETFGNAYRSALKAGYEDTSSTQITDETWFIEKVKTLNMLDKAEENLNEFLEIEDKKGERFRVKADITKFVAERVGKARYSTRQDVTSGGEPIIVDVKINQMTTEQIDEYLKNKLNASTESRK